MSDEREAVWCDLLRRANRGDQQAYRCFLHEVTPVLRRIVRARRHSSAEECEDIVQEILLAIHMKRHTWREDAPVSPWLYAIARYKSADANRRSRSRAAVPLEEIDEMLPAPSDRTARYDTQRLLARLDARSARIVRAIAIEGQSATEAGAPFDMTDNAVRVAFHRAMGRLSRMIRGDG